MQKILSVKQSNFQTCYFDIKQRAIAVFFKSDTNCPFF